MGEQNWSLIRCPEVYCRYGTSYGIVPFTPGLVLQVAKPYRYHVPRISSFFTSPGTLFGGTLLHLEDRRALSVDVPLILLKFRFLCEPHCRIQDHGGCCGLFHLFIPSKSSKKCIFLLSIIVFS